MPHLYDIDDNYQPIKHAQYKHDSVQEAMGKISCSRLAHAT
jgi:hypothetical protein